MNFARFAELITLGGVGFMLGLNEAFWLLVFLPVLAIGFAKINMEVKL